MITKNQQPDFNPAMQKIGGRKNLDPKTHLRKVKRSVREYLDEINTNPIAELIKLARQKKTPIEIRAKCWAEVAKFAYPKLSTVALHHSGEVTHNHQIFKTIMNNPELAEMAERLALAAADARPALPKPSEVIDLDPIPDSVEEPGESPETE